MRASSVTIRYNSTIINNELMNNHFCILAIAIGFQNYNPIPSPSIMKKNLGTYNVQIVHCADWLVVYD